MIGTKTSGLWSFDLPEDIRDPARTTLVLSNLLRAIADRVVRNLGRVLEGNFRC